MAEHIHIVAVAGPGLSLPSCYGLPPRGVKPSPDRGVAVVPPANSDTAARFLNALLNALEIYPERWLLERVMASPTEALRDLLFASSPVSPAWLIAARALEAT